MTPFLGPPYPANSRAQGVALGVGEVLGPEEGVAEGEPGGDIIFRHQVQHCTGVLLPTAHPSAAPEAVRRSAVDGADPAPGVKILPAGPEQGQKDPVEFIKLEQAGEMVIGDGLFHGVPPDSSGAGIQVVGQVADDHHLILVIPEEVDPQAIAPVLAVPLGQMPL